MSLKSAYDISLERTINPKYTKEYYEFINKKMNPEDPSESVNISGNFEEKKREFIEVVGFNDNDKEGVLIEETKETKSMLLPNEDADDAEIMQKTEILEEEKMPEIKENSEEEQMEVYWRGNFFDYGGFARMNRTMAFGLANRNVKVKVEIETYLDHINQATKNELEILANNDISPNAPKVYGVTVPTDIRHSGKKILYTMIETSEKVHPDYAGKLNLVDEIWTPTRYGEKILKNSNVHPPIHVIPLGVDFDRYKPNLKSIKLSKQLRNFVFISVFRWSYRKGFDILLKAFMEEFGSEEDVSLLMVSRIVDRPEELGSKKIMEDFKDIRSFVAKSDENLPHIALYNKPVLEKDMPGVYNSANAFVLITRGEGFCLPMAEAGSCELPVIASNCSGHTDFLTEDNSYLVEPSGYSEAKVGGNMSNMAKLCHFYEGQIFPNFDKNTIEQTQEKMRYVYENYDVAKTRAKKLRKEIVKNYNWDTSVDMVYERLKNI